MDQPRRSTRLLEKTESTISGRLGKSKAITERWTSPLPIEPGADPHTTVATRGEVGDEEKRVRIKEEDADTSMDHIPGDRTLPIMVDDKKDVKDRKIKIKVKEEVCLLSMESVERRLRAFNAQQLHIEADPEFTSIGFGRFYLGRVFGGNTMDDKVIPAKARIEEHHVPILLYPNVEWNPHCPRQVGAPGLIFTGWSEIFEDKIQDSKDDKKKYAKKGKELLSIPMFVKLGTKSAAGSIAWTYLGHYQVQGAEPLTVEEWLSQNEKAREKWVQGIYHQLWGANIQVRILWRQRNPDALGGPSTAVAQDLAAEIRTAWKADNPLVTKDEIRAMVDNGDWRVPVCCVKCVEYRESFQQSIVDKQDDPRYQAKPKTKKPSRRKRARQDTDSDAASSPSLDDDTGPLPKKMKKSIARNGRHPVQSPRPTKPGTLKKSRSRKVASAAIIGSNQDSDNYASD